MLRLSSQSVVYQRIVKDVKMALFAPDIFLFSNRQFFEGVCKEYSESFPLRFFNPYSPIGYKENIMAMSA